MNFIGDGGTEREGGLQAVLSHSLSERQPRQCHLVKILKAPQRILFWILFTVALGRLSFPSPHPLFFSFLPAEGHVNTCRKPFANPPLHTQLKRSSAFFLVAVVVVVGRVSKLPNFFLGFLLLFPFFFVLCFCLLYLPLPLAACRCPAEAINVLSCQRSAAAAVRNCYGQKRNSAGYNKREREWRGGEGRGNGESEKWKVEKPNEKEREKYLLCSLVGFPVPCLLAPKAII